MGNITLVKITGFLAMVAMAFSLNASSVLSSSSEPDAAISTSNVVILDR